MVEYVDMVSHVRAGGKLTHKTVKLQKKKNIRVQLMTDIEQFVKIQTFMRKEENVFDCNNESQATFKIIDNYFEIVDKIEKWKRIAIEQMEINKELEKKAGESWNERKIDKMSTMRSMLHN